MSGWDPAAVELLELMARAARGPRREGLYALWLTLRVARDLQLDPPMPERLHRRRVAALTARLTSLTPPAPLRRALEGALHMLRDATPSESARILSQLVTPVRESIGPDAAEAVARAALAARRG